MTRRDHAVVGVLVLLFAMLAAATAVPDLQTAAVPSATPTATSAAVVPYREGILGRPVSVSPLTARGAVDRDLVALVFNGLVRLGPDGAFVPDLAASWSVEDEGRTWTFRLRDDATWQDGEPVTADDVAFTIRTLQDPDYAGPAAASWEDVTVSTEGERTVRFTLQTPLGGFLQAATQPIAPAHLLADVPVEALPESEFGRQPIGSGPFAIVALDEDHAELVPAASVRLSPPGPDGVPSAAPTDSLATPAPTIRPDRPVPYLPGIEFRFFDDPEALAAAYRDGQLDAASGLPASDLLRLADETGSRVLHDPGSTLTAVAFNLRPSRPAFREAAVRRALLAAIDRGRLIDDAFGGAAARADAPIPPASWAFDVGASTPVAFDRAAAEKALTGAGWKRLAVGWALPKAKSPFAFELISPDEASNPSAYRAAVDVAADWTALGLAVRHRPLSPDELVAALRANDYAAAVIDVNIGLDPDLYPLLASTQATSRRSNLIGLQDPDLDKLLVAARGYGTETERRGAYAELQRRLADRQYLLPLAFRDLLVVFRERVTGPSIRQVDDPGDRFWDVLTWRLASDR